MASVNRSTDAPSSAVFMLDMGWRPYGDCIVCRFGETSVLIDGGHKEDIEPQNGFPSIPQQLAQVLGHDPPFDLSLLIVTHCHSDHAGCLPELVADGVVRAQWALVADEEYGFGHVDGDQSYADLGDANLPPEIRRAVLALREEDHAELRDDAALDQFLRDAENVERSYRKMLDDLRRAGTKVVRYGRDSHDELLRAFAHVGMEILGPTPEQLQLCARQIAAGIRDALEAAQDLVLQDRAPNPVALYRSLVRLGETDAMDRPGRGAATNGQSIVACFAPGGRKILLTGDMQFAKPEVSGLDDLMAQLRSKVREHGPYAFVKVAHHASYNAFDQQVLEDLQGSRLLGISGGTNDRGHPAPKVLRLLKANRENLQWGRTDKNGLVTVALGPGGVDMKPSRGRLNDAVPNQVDTGLPAGEPAPARTKKVTAPVRTRMAAAGGNVVEVTAVVPMVPTTVRLTIDVEPRAARGEVPATPQPRPAPAETETPQPPSRRGPDPLPQSLSIAAGRRLPKLLFVTSAATLAKNIGERETELVLTSLRGANQQVLHTLPEQATAAAAAAEVRRKLTSDVEGVVLIGGYDVVAPTRLDVLDPQLRAALGGSGGDPDNFIVWNDELYGDRNGDGMPEIPVSRIPDARSPELVFAALQADRPQPGDSRFGIRNVYRPFAEGIFAALPGVQPILVSETASPATVTSHGISAQAVYFMLHGAWQDSARFWGEDRYCDAYEAVNVRNIPSHCRVVAFAGCCWGALCVDKPALQALQGEPVAPRTPESSMALGFLKAGALAFVGCTGVHYSPSEPPYRYYGGPMHEAFWKSWLAGLPPAKALFEAKKEYLGGIPHRDASPMSRAIEIKILRQYTCLGLGW